MSVNLNSDAAAERAPRTLSWRVVDIVVAAVLGVAVGLVMLGWNAAWPWFDTMLTPVAAGMTGLIVGIWLLGGVLGGLVIRKPGAAILVEMIAATVSMLLGSQWGWTTLVSGFLQGLGAEVVFAAFAYRGWKVGHAMLAGAVAALFEFPYEWFTTHRQYAVSYQITYFTTMVISGALLAGLLGWLLTRALAATGVLHRFASGREQTDLV